MIICTIHHIARATSYSHGAGAYSSQFDTVTMAVGSGDAITLLLPSGTGKSVADAINAAVKTAIEEGET